jgi:hypothetical protein
MGFKFLNTEQIPEQPEYITEERFNELVGYQLNMDVHNPLSTDNRPAVFLTLTTTRDGIPQQEWEHILERQRQSLIQYMWQQGMITQTVISQDEYGLTLRTEINF